MMSPIIEKMFIVDWVTSSAKVTPIKANGNDAMMASG